MRSHAVRALLVLAAGVLLGIGALCCGLFPKAGGPLPSQAAQGAVPRPWLACGQIAGALQEGMLPCAFQQPRTPPPPNQLGSCPVTVDCDSLQALLGAWTTALAILVGSLGTLWVVEGCVVALRPGHRESVWDTMINRLMSVGIIFYIAWRVDDFSQLVVDVLVAHKSDQLPFITGQGQFIDASPPTALLVDVIGRLIIFLSQCFLMFFAPRVLFQVAESIGALLWVPERDSGRAGHRAVMSLLGLIGLGAWLVFAPLLVGTLFDWLSGA